MRFPGRDDQGTGGTLDINNLAETSEGLAVVRIGLL